MGHHWRGGRRETEALLNGPCRRDDRVIIHLEALERKGDGIKVGRMRYACLYGWLIQRILMEVAIRMRSIDHVARRAVHCWDVGREIGWTLTGLWEWTGAG